MVESSMRKFCRAGLRPKILSHFLVITALNFITLLSPTLSAWAAKTARHSHNLTEAQIKKQFSYAELDCAVRGLVSAVDGHAWCAVSDKQARVLLLPLRPVYQGKKKSAQQPTNAACKKMEKKLCRSRLLPSLNAIADREYNAD